VSRGLFRRLAAALLAAIMGGCAALSAQAPYEDLSRTTMADADASAGSGPPRLVESAGDPKMDVFLMLDQGFAVIGESPFFGSAENPTAVLDQARSVGAALVLVGGKYRAEEGGESSYIRYGVERYEHWALYFAPLPKGGLGVLLDRMTPGQREAAKGAGGLQVIAIRKGSPAAQNDIVIGDVILSLGGRAVTDLASYRSAVASAGSGDTVIALLRDGKPRSVTVNLAAW